MQKEERERKKNPLYSLNFGLAVILPEAISAGSVLAGHSNNT